MKNKYLILICALVLLAGFALLIRYGSKESKKLLETEYKIVNDYDYSLKPLEKSLEYFGQVERYNDGRPNPMILKLIQQFSPKSSVDLAWCSALMIDACRNTGYEHSTSLVARSWLTVGKSVRDSPKVGDVIVFWRVSPSSWQGHVGFYICEDPNNSDYVISYGGNISNKATFQRFKKSTVLDIRRLEKISNGSEFAPQQDLIVGFDR